MNIERINIIGKGNVGTHLHKALSPFYKVNLIASRNLDPDSLPEADITIIAVADSVIYDICKLLSTSEAKHGIILHTAGSIGLDVLDIIEGPKGVLYPMQTFSKDKQLDYSQIPFFIEADSEHTASRINELVKIISSKIEYANSDRRKAMHIAAVLTCNFANHLWALAETYLNKYNLDFSLMYPLLVETAEKAQKMSPSSAQTGPAYRGDQSVIKSHLEALKDDEQIYNIYKTLSESIFRHHEQNKL